MQQKSDGRISEKKNTHLVARKRWDTRYCVVMKKKNILHMYIDIYTRVYIYIYIYIYMRKISRVIKLN